MKVECPICHVQGLLQQRGCSQRIQHYNGFINGKRMYSYHKLEVKLGSNGSKLLEVKGANASTFSGIKAGPMGFEPTTFSLEG